MNIEAFEQWAHLKGLQKEEMQYYFTQTLKNIAQKWYYHYLPAKLMFIIHSFIVRFNKKWIDEELLCAQRKDSVEKAISKEVHGENLGFDEKA